MAEEEGKKQEGGQPPSETVLAQPVKERDPDEAVFAEQAIQAYATEALDHFRTRSEHALEAVAAWLDSQSNVEELANGALNARMGQAFLHQMVHACHGHHTPIGAVAFEELDGVVDQAVRNERDPTLFVAELTEGVRQLSWYLRDNLQSVLSNHWDHVRDLAYSGSRDFEHALHALGLPRFDWSAHGLKSSLVAMGEHVAANRPRTQEEALDKNPKVEEKAAEQVMLQEEEKAQQAT